MNIKLLKSYHWIDLPLNIAVLVIYLGIAKLGLAFSIIESSVTIFWPAGGFSLAILLLAGPKYIPGIFSGALAAALIIDSTLGFAIASALGNTLETICAYWLLTYFQPINRLLDNTPDLFKLLFYGAAISTLISAFMGVISLIVFEQVEPSLFPEIALRWWMADAIGIAFVTPLILIWHQSRHPLNNKIYLELIALFFLTILMGKIVIFHWFIPPSFPDPSIAWLLPFIIWSGLRAGRHYTALLVLIIFLQALWGASHNLGHYANAMQENGLINFWGFGMLITVGGMLLAIMTTERKREHERQQKLAHQLPGAIYQYQLFPNGHACFPYASEGIHEVYELSPEQIRDDASAVFAILHPDDLDRIVTSIQVSADNMTLWEIEYRVVLPIKGVRWLSGSARPEFIRDGSTLWHGFITDITERKQIEHALRKSEQEINLILKTVPDMIWLKDKDGVYLNCNAMFERFFGADKAKIIGKTDYDFVDIELADFFRQHDKAAMKAKQATINEEWLSFTDDGHRILCETTKTPFNDENGNLIGVLGISHDITKRKEAEDKIRHLAMTDQLTGLANRTQFNQYCMQNMKLANREGKSLALMMIDLDKFKPVNDTFGHPAGDALLQAAAAIFIKFTRETDLVVRLGGDEFAILVIHPKDADSVAKNAQRIIDEINKPLTIMGNKIQIGASIGIALYPNDADNQEDLLKNADLALYKVKDSGRGTFAFYHSDMQSA